MNPSSNTSAKTGAKTKSRVPFSSTVESESASQSEEEEEASSGSGESGLHDGDEGGYGNDDHNLSMALEVINLSSLQESPSWPGTPVDTTREVGLGTGGTTGIDTTGGAGIDNGNELEEVSLEDVDLGESVSVSVSVHREQKHQETPSTPASSSTSSSSDNHSTPIPTTPTVSESTPGQPDPLRTEPSIIPTLPNSPHLLRIRQPTINSWEYDVVFLSPPYGFTISRATTETDTGAGSGIGIGSSGISSTISTQSMASLLSSTSPVAAIITKLAERGKAAQQGVELGDTVVAVNNIWTPTYEKVLSVLAQVKLQQTQHIQHISNTTRGNDGNSTSSSTNPPSPRDQEPLVVFRLKRSLSYIIGSTTAMIASESSKVN